MVTSNIEPILIITGLLTASMVAQLFAPSWTFRHIYGEPLSGAGITALGRHWALLLFCVGALLVYSAFHPELRKPAVVLASIEKVGFVAGVFATSLRNRRMLALMAAADAAMTLTYILYLFRL